MSDKLHRIEKEPKYINYKNPATIRLKPCKHCGCDMSGRDVAKFFYEEGSGTKMQIVCKCGMQTKKVMVNGEENAYAIWNRRPE